MAIGQQGMTCTNHEPSHSASVPTAGAGSKVERYAAVQLAIGVDASHATVLLVNQNAPVCFGDIQCKLDHLLLRHFSGCTRKDIRNMWQHPVVRDDRVGGDIADGTVHNQAW